MSQHYSSFVHCARLSELLRRCQLMIQVQSHAVLRKEKRQDGAISEWWKHANICERVTLPSWCLAQDDHRSGTRQRKVVPVWELHYHLSHQLLQDVADFQGGAEQPALSSTPSKSLHADLFARARSLENKAVNPCPENVKAQCGSGSFGPHQCIRQLALIELVDHTLADLPLSHDSLLKEIHARRQDEACQCRVLTELIEAAVKRLIDYSQDSARGFANWRFLNMMVRDEQGNARTACDVSSAQSVIRQMVHTLAAAFEK